MYPDPHLCCRRSGLLPLGSVPQIRTYAELDDAQLEALLRERAFKIDAELRVEETGIEGYPWRAAFQVYDVPSDLAPQGASRTAVEAPTKREALVSLAQTEDLERMQQEWKDGQAETPPDAAGST